MTDGPGVEAPPGAPAAGIGSEPHGAPERPSRSSTLVLLGCWAILVVPLLVALVAARRPHWFPLADLAQYELRVRDVGTGDTPLVGLAGRIGPWYDPGSHPGPLSFWLLAPVYRLLGSSSWALMASAVTLHSAAAGLVLWMGRRRAGTGFVIGATIALATLMRFYGATLFIEPWNPYLPVLWWVVLLVAVWSVLDGDAPMVVPAVVAGSFAAQTHLPYVGLVGGLGAFLAVPLGLSLWRGRRAEDRAEAHRTRRWTLIGIGVAVVLWTPPVLDQIWGVGNLTRIKDSVTSPTEAVSGFRGGIPELLRNLDPTALLTGRDLTTVSPGGSVAWGALVLLVAWGASSLLAARRGHRRAARLDAVLAAALVLAVVSSTRIYGVLWSYLFLWSWGLCTVLCIATAQNVWALLPRRPSLDGATGTRAAAGGLVVAALVAGSFALANRDAGPDASVRSVDLGTASAQVVAALEERDGDAGRLLVRWDDPVAIGSQGFGLLNELERQGFDVGVDPGFGVGATRHRILERDDATLVVQLATGSAIADWDRDPTARQVAYVDARTPTERARFEQLDARVERELAAAGLADLVPEWRGNAFTTSVDADVPPPIRDLMRETLAIRFPVAVYLIDPADAA